MNRPKGKSEHYFSSEPIAPVHATEYRFTHEGREFTMAAESGVFASRGLDKATAVLLDTVRRHGTPRLTDGSTVVDVGCGSGALACALAVSYPTCHVLAIDVNDRARSLTSANAERNGLTTITTLDPAQTDPDARVSAIWSNPPIRVGKEALHNLLDEWLPRLAPDGYALLVVGKNLGADSLADWIRGRGYVVDRLASSKGFRVLRVTR